MNEDKVRLIRLRIDGEVQTDIEDAMAAMRDKFDEEIASGGDYSHQMDDTLQPIVDQFTHPMMQMMGKGDPLSLIAGLILPGVELWEDPTFYNAEELDND